MGCSMHRWVHFFGALALVLLLWTGGPAYAGERQLPIAVAADSAGHFAGDKDEVPSDQHKGAPHHHFSCGEHVAAPWKVGRAVADRDPMSVDAPRRPSSVLDGREPDTHIRPPIA